MSIIDTTKLITKLFAELLKKSITIEVQEALMKLREEAIELQEDNIQVRAKNIDLIEKNEKLKEEIKLSKVIKYEAPYYWKIIDGKKEGPFCQNCYDDQKKLIRLQKVEDEHWECRACKNNYFTEDFKERDIPTFGERESGFGPGM